MMQAKRAIGKAIFYIYSNDEYITNIVSSLHIILHDFWLVFQV